MLLRPNPGRIRIQCLREHTAGRNSGSHYFPCTATIRNYIIQTKRLIIPSSVQMYFFPSPLPHTWPGRLCGLITLTLFFLTSSQKPLLFRFDSPSLSSSFYKVIIYPSPHQGKCFSHPQCVSFSHIFPRSPDHVLR